MRPNQWFMDIRYWFFGITLFHQQQTRRLLFELQVATGVHRPRLSWLSEPDRSPFAQGRPAAFSFIRPLEASCMDPLDRSTKKTHVFRAMVRFLANGSVTQTRPLEFHLNSNGTFWRLGWTLFSASGKPAGSGSGGIWNLRSSEANYQNDRTPPFFVSLTLLMFLLRNSCLAHGQLGLPGHILLSYILLCSWAFKDKLVPFHGTWLVIWNLHNGLW